MPSSITTRGPSRPVGWARRLGAAALLAATACVQAENIGVATHDVTAAAGGTATVVFDFDFSTRPSLTSFGALIDYDPARLVLTQDVVTVMGVATDPAAFFAPADYHTTFDPALGHLSVLWLPLSNPLAVVPLSGTAQWSLTYQIAPGFAAPGSSMVVLDFTYSDVDGDDGLVNGATRSPQSATVSVSAVAGVPEPGTWALTLAALGVVGAARLRRRRQADAT